MTHSLAPPSSHLPLLLHPPPPRPRRRPSHPARSRQVLGINEKAVFVLGIGGGDVFPAEGSCGRPADRRHFLLLLPVVAFSILIMFTTHRYALFHKCLRPALVPNVRNNTVCDTSFRVSSCSSKTYWSPAVSPLSNLSISFDNNCQCSFTRHGSVPKLYN